MKREWPLEVGYLIDEEGDGSIVCYYSRGHHEKNTFIAEALKEHDVIVAPTDVYQKYMRWSMVTGPNGPCHVGEEYAEPGRGRFPITVCWKWEPV